MAAELEASGQAPQSMIEHFLAGGCSPRVGMSQDHAPMVTLLLSDEGRWINGQVIHVDGGALFN